MSSSIHAPHTEDLQPQAPAQWTAPTASGPTIAHTRINANGRIVIPAAIREELGLQKGDTLMMEVEGGVLRIESYLARIRRIQAEFAHLVPPGRRLSDELIAERRQEALLEQETFERAREFRRIRDGFADPERLSPPDDNQRDRSGVPTLEVKAGEGDLG